MVSGASTNNGCGNSNYNGGPDVMLIDGTTLAPDHWWRLV
jgi:hypothetical protein